MLRFAKPDSPFFQTEHNRKKTDEASWSFNFSPPPPLSLNTKNSWGGFQEASLVAFTFFAAFSIVFIIVSVRRRRGVNGRG
jgi:hypothetical protein